MVIENKNINLYSKKELDDIFNGSLDVDALEKELEDIEIKRQQYDQKSLRIARTLEYYRLFSLGFSQEDIINFMKEDNRNILFSERFLKKYNKLKEYMFGYPANLLQDSVLVKYFKQKEINLNLMNNCADTYQQGNYQMDSKEFERRILDNLFIHFGLNPPVLQQDGSYKGPWGYITSGGSESNRWGIENGLKRLKGGMVYFSEAAHYSVEKAVRMGLFYNGKTIEIPYTKITTEDNSEKINRELLISEIYNNWNKNKTPAIIVLTWGTTKTGAIDDVSKISEQLKDIPHYIHLDAALFGGIAKNQINAPTIPNIIDLDVDSIAVSFHKYIGTSEVKSAVLAKERPSAHNVDYIGQTDSTTAGSRNINPFSMLQKLTEALHRKCPTYYSKNVELFEHLLIENKINYKREDFSNIFLIEKPSDVICKKYQLSTFMDNGTEKAHIIIFPYHKENVIKELINDLAES